jgi:hypothetical protein
MIKVYKLFVEKRQVRHGVGFLGIYEGIILNCALREKDVEVRAGINWLRKEFNKCRSVVKRKVTTLQQLRSIPRDWNSATIGRKWYTSQTWWSSGSEVGHPQSGVSWFSSVPPGKF